MNLNQLSASVQQTSQELREKRHTESKELSDQGKTLVAQAQAEEFNNKDLLKQAIDVFMEAIHKNRRNPDPYVGLGYLMYLINERDLAIFYLQDVLSFDPENEPAQALLEEVLKPSTPDTETKAQDISTQLGDKHPDSQIDYDELYDKVESIIFKEVKRLSSEQNQALSLTIEPVAYQKLKDFHHSLIQTQNTINDQLLIIDKEIDTSHLRQLMHPIDIYIKRVHQIIVLCQKSSNLLREINKEHSFVEKFREQIAKSTNPEEIKHMEAKVEQLLDHCDQLADRLDELDKKGVLLKDIESHYEKLVESTQTLLEMIEDVNSHFDF